MTGNCKGKQNHLSMYPVCVVDSTSAYVNSDLYKFDYTTDLNDTTSYRFMNEQHKFCLDVSCYKVVAIWSVYPFKSSL